MSLILRNTKGSPLTYNEMDDNLTYLEGIAGSSQDLSTTLVAGNTTGANDIIIDTTQSIKSGNGSGKIELDWTGNQDTIFLSADNTAVFDTIIIDPNQTYNGTGIYNDDTINNDMYASIVLIGGHIEETSANSFTNVTSKLTIDATNGTGINSESITTGNISSIGLNPNTIVSTATDTASTITDTISIDPQGLGIGTTMLSENATTGAFGKVSVLTNLIDIQSNDGGVNTISAQYTTQYTTIEQSCGTTPDVDTFYLDPQNFMGGTGIRSHSNTTTNLSETRYTPDTIISTATDTTSTVTDTISIDPQGLVTGTGIKSENTTTGISTSIGVYPDQTTIEGAATGVSSLTTFSGASIVSSATDAASTVTDTISIDPQGLVTGTGIKSENTTTGETSLTMYQPSNILQQVSQGLGFTTIDSGGDYVTILATDGTTPGSKSLTIDTNNINFNMSGVNKFFDGRKLQTINNTTTTAIQITPPSSNAGYIFKVIIKAIDTTYTNVYGAELLGVFKTNTGTVTQVSTTDKTEKTLFSTATSDIDTDGTYIRVRVTGETGKTINWEVSVEYI